MCGHDAGERIRTPTAISKLGFVPKRVANVVKTFGGPEFAVNPETLDEFRYEATVR
jgi:hypothetical protein